MECFRGIGPSRLSRLWIFLGWILLTGGASVAKVVKLYNAWPDKNYAFQVLGWWDGKNWNGPNTSGNVPVRNGNWYDFTLPSTYDANVAVSQSGIFYSLSDWSVAYDNTGLNKGQAFIDIASVLRTSDTVWIIPSPLPDGAPLLSGTRPRQTTLLFLSPWDTLTPSVQVENSPWAAMKPSTIPQWYSRFAMGFSSLSVSFRNPDSSATFGTLGTAGGGALVIPDSLADRDTVWVYSKADGTGMFSSTKPVSKVLMLLNPWGGSVPIHHPRVSISGGSPMGLSPAGRACGWYSFSYYNRPRNALLSDDRSSATAGADGMGGVQPIDLETIFAASDTAWISFDSIGRSLQLSPNWNGRLGVCEIVQLAATIRDFPTYRNKEFGRGAGCAQGSWGVVPGMVEPVLGLDRKPVRSASTFGSNVNGRWVGRCVYDTALEDAVVADTGLGTNWFHDDASQGVAYGKTCRDLPLSLDSTGEYTNDSPLYFPIDDFATQSDGTPNPGFDQENGDDGKPHNFGFCMESHGTFDYTKGQVFNFAGDDDVWFFINNHLVVDIGGIHSTSTGSVQLDTLGTTVSGSDTTRASWALIEGRTYTWDFFFCEREPSGSDMKISTSMNLRTASGFQVADTLTSAGAHRYTSYVSRTNGQGCQAITQVTRSASRFELLGEGWSKPVSLGTGTWYGGIEVDTTEGTAVLDTGKVFGLAPGDYTLRIRSNIDSLAFQDIPFRIPYTAAPRFVDPAPYTGLVGSAFPIRIGAFNKFGVDSGAIPFGLRPIPGVSYFRDSLLTSRIGPNDTLLTGINGGIRRLWVKGEQEGSYFLVVGRGAQDSADGYGPVTFQGKGLRFLDSLGNPVVVQNPIERLVGDSVRFWFETFSSGATCTTCGSVVVLVASVPGIALDGRTGADTVTLVGGRGSILVTGRQQVTAGTLRATLSNDSSATTSWSPIRFRVQGPDSAWVLDRDGNGTADRFVVQLHHTWTATSSLAFGWPDTSKRVGAEKGNLSLSPDSLRVTVDFGSGFPRGTTSGDSKRAGEYSHGGEASQAFAIIDRIAPVPLSASLRFGRDGGRDVLTIVLSEPIKATGDTLIENRSAGMWDVTQQMTWELSATGDSLLLSFAPGDVVHCPVPGDSVRLSSLGGIADRLGNIPGTPRAAVVVQGGVRPPQVAWMLDSDGDGRIDAAVVRFAQALRGTVPPFTFRIAGQVREVEGTVDPKDSTRVLVRFSDAFPFAVTSFDGSGAGGMDDHVFDLLDSVPPTIRQASLHLAESYTDPDTLVIVASEDIVLDSIEAWLTLKQGSRQMDVHEVSRRASGDTLFLLLPVDDPNAIRSGDSVRFVSTGAVEDGPGNVPSADAIWHRISGGRRSPVMRILPPTPLVWLDPTQSGSPQRRPLQLLTAGGDTSSWSDWDGPIGSSGDQACPRTVCNGPQLEVNSPLALSIYIVDNIGTHVASGHWSIDANDFARLPVDRLGRVRLRVSWDGRSATGGRVADGVYILRMILKVPGDEGQSPRMVNRLWNVGIGTRRD